MFSLIVKGINILKIKTIFFISSVLCVLSPPIFAGGEPVNCKNEVTGKVALYEGYASCYTGSFFIQEYVPTTTSPFKTLTAYDSSIKAYRSCSARVPFFKYENVISEVCDYYPTATLLVDNFSSNEVYVKAGGNDKDGSVSVKLVIDGQVQSGTSKVLFGYVGQLFEVESIVTDNDGYVSKKVAYAIIKDTGSITPPPF